ncbi:hypothetical protein [uncultured Flavobacterium sp.]|uniref:hypothetical protein n=1 Tax=uncultured Flavobacterium sp. TaxID=165435 RepID=UPI0025EDEC0C|nr:hypothetical protein [uncultured Flavobacterium sp.]
MDYQYAKDAFEELRNFDGKADFKGSQTVIDYFVLLPKSGLEGFDIETFLKTYQATGSFEVEGGHEEEKYTIIGINASERNYSNDVDYFLKLLVW